MWQILWVCKNLEKQPNVAVLFYYLNGPKFWDFKVGANSADPGSSLFAIPFASF